MSPHERQLIDDLAELRRAKNIAELEAARWAARFERLGGNYLRRQLLHALSELRLCKRDLQILENQLSDGHAPDGTAGMTGNHIAQQF